MTTGVTKKRIPAISKIIVHAFGLSLLVGRIIHARGILSGNLKERVLGMQVTISTIIALGLSNVVTLPYENLFKL